MQEKDIQLLKEQLAYMKRMMFGKKSERFVDPNQLSLELASEEPASVSQSEPLPKEVIQKKDKKRPVRRPHPQRSATCSRDD